MFEPYFSLAYDGPPFGLFSPLHLVALALVVVSCLLLAFGLRGADEHPRRREFLRHGIAAFSLLNLVAWQLWQAYAGVWTAAYSLPLHVCTFSNLLGAILLWNRSYRLFEVMYFWGFAGGTQALLTPDIGRFGFPHFVFLIFFTSHGVILLCVVFMIAAYGYRPYWASIRRATLVTLLFLASVGVVNWLTGGNYMFVGRKPEFPSLIDYLGPWPWYIASMVVVGVLAFVIVYLPYAIYDWYVQANRRSLRAGA